MRIEGNWMTLYRLRQKVVERSQNVTPLGMVTAFELLEDLLMAAGAVQGSNHGGDRSAVIMKSWPGYEVLVGTRFLGYAMALLQNSIWYKRKRSGTLKSMLDGAHLCALDGRSLRLAVAVNSDGQKSSRVR